MKNNNESNTATTFLYWAVAIASVILLIGFLTCNHAAGQTITKIYAKSGATNYRIRIDGSTPHNKDTADVFFPGGGFVSQNWEICYKWSAQSLKRGHTSFEVGYPTAFLFPTASAANKGIDFSVLAVLYIKAHADEFGIDTNAIFLFGTSAGGFCAMGVAYQHQIKVAGVLNGWGGVLNLNYLSQSSVPVYNVSTDIDKIVPINCGNAFGVPCCGSEAIYNELTLRDVQTDWLVWEGYKHGLVPKDAQYNMRVEESYNQAQLFFK